MRDLVTARADQLLLGQVAQRVLTPEEKRQAMTQSEMYRKAQRIIETSESDEAVQLAGRALKELEEDESEAACEDLRRADWMEA